MSAIRACGFLVLMVAFGAVPSRAALKTADVPTFKLRARIVSTERDKKGTTSKHIFRLGKIARSAENGEWTDWMEFWLPEAKEALKAYPNLYLHAFPVVTHLAIDRITDTTRVEVELQFDENKQVVPLHGELFGPNLGILVWRDAEKKPMAGTMADYNRVTYWKVVDAVSVPAERRPKKFPIVDRFICGDDDRIDWREGLAALSRAGYSVITAPPSKPVRALMKEAGIERTGGGVYSPPGGPFQDPIPPAKSPEPLDTWAQKEAKRYLDAGYAPKDIAWFALADEPGWYMPSIYRTMEKPEAMDRFHAYLKNQGLMPGDLGAATWEEVKPIGFSSAKDLPTRRLYYWTQRFFSWDSSRYFADATRAFEQAFYPGIPLSTNLNFFAGRFYCPGPFGNNRDKQSPDAAMGGHDWFEFGRMRACTMLWTEDWFGDAAAPQWSFYCARLRCASEKSGVSFGGYVVPRAGGDREEGLMQKMLCLAGSGAKAINTYTFGPEYNFPGNCYSQRPQLLAKLAEANGMIGAADDLLFDGKRPHSQVAILAPRSAEPWDQKDPLSRQMFDATNTNMNGGTVDYMAEVADLYLALQHANIPVDFVEEDDLSIKGLSPYRVLYVTEPNIPAELQRGLAEWVKAGGTLVTVAGAGARDRYDEPCTVLADLQGMNEAPRERQIMLKLADLKDSGAVNGKGGPITAVGTHGTLSKPQGDILATFEDGAPALVHRAVREGQILHFAWMPGISYVRSAHEKSNGLAAGFSATLRNWICEPVYQAKLTFPVHVDHPLVETPILLSEKGAAITVLNWTGEPIPNLTVRICVPFDVKSAVAVRGGPLKIESKKGEIAVQLPVAGADIIMLRR